MAARVLPQYGGGSLVNLMASVLEACGGPRRHPALELLPARELVDERNVVLLILDGFAHHEKRARAPS